MNEADISHSELCAFNFLLPREKILKVWIDFDSNMIQRLLNVKYAFRGHRTSYPHINCLQLLSCNSDKLYKCLICCYIQYNTKSREKPFAVVGKVPQTRSLIRRFAGLAPVDGSLGWSPRRPSDSSDCRGGSQLVRCHWAGDGLVIGQ